MDPLRISERVCARPYGPRWASPEGGEDIPAISLRHLSDFDPTLRRPSDIDPTSVRLRSDFHLNGMRLAKVEDISKDISKVIGSHPPAEGRTPPARPSSAALRAVASRPFGPRENPLIHLTGFPVHFLKVNGFH
jgi:hypothetical protein